MQDDPHESSPDSPPAPPSRPRTPLGPVRWVIVFTRGLILDQHLRRLAMFYVIIAAMLMAFAGEIFLSDWLRQNPWRFLLYYLACAWLTVVAALLAIYDLLMLRLQHRAIRRRLRTDILGDEPKDRE